MTGIRPIGDQPGRLPECAGQPEGRHTVHDERAESGSRQGRRVAPEVRPSLRSDKRFGLGRRTRVVLALTVGVVVLAAGWSTSLEVDKPSTATAAGPPSLGAVQNLYSADLVARINAERAARNTPGASVPQLQVDPGLTADAQAWSAHLAATGSVADPTLPPCRGAANQVCVFAANSGATGYGYWPGDGSDGMDGAYMTSAGHRQNELGAAYTDVGVGVTCSGSQAWTVELSGTPTATSPPPTPGRRPRTRFRETRSVPARSWPAPPPASRSYCPGQNIGPNGAVTATGGQFRYPFAVAPVPGEPIGGAGAAVGHGRHRRCQRVLGGQLGRIGHPPR